MTLGGAKLPNWTGYIKVLESVYGLGSTSIDEGGRLWVSLDMSPIAIISDGGDGKSIILSTRASLLPAETALLCCAVKHAAGQYVEVLIAENFDFSDSGEWLFGVEALAFVAKNAVRLWSDVHARLKSRLEKTEISTTYPPLYKN